MVPSRGYFLFLTVAGGSRHRAVRLFGLRQPRVVLALGFKAEALCEAPCTEAMAEAHEFERKYWVINNPDDIRAYGVLIRCAGLWLFVESRMINNTYKRHVV